LKTQKLPYSDGKSTYIGYLAIDEQVSGRRPGVVVFPDAFGLADHARQRAERLALLGYAALAADMNGDGRVTDDMATVGPSIRSLYADRAEWRRRARAALSALLAQPQVDSQRVAAIGFCFGGTTALELARSGAALAAIATFHAGLLPEMAEDAGCIRARVLICNGAEDPLVTKEAIEAVVAELRRDKIDWQFVQYGNAVHGFTDPEAHRRNRAELAYEPRAEARSWAAMCRLLEEAFS
jgi:dienelactone hydrolase